MCLCQLDISALSSVTLAARFLQLSAEHTSEWLAAVWHEKKQAKRKTWSGFSSASMCALKKFQHVQRLLLLHKQMLLCLKFPLLGVVHLIASCSPLKISHFQDRLCSVSADCVLDPYVWRWLHSSAFHCQVKASRWFLIAHISGDRVCWRNFLFSQ